MCHWPIVIANEAVLCLTEIKMVLGLIRAYSVPSLARFDSVGIRWLRDQSCSRLQNR
ncbi:hypothetical protein DFP91_5351 [Pseudorhodoplanes sinuspersici]|nr:hypothetical protein DFP91_5351 [Pseudorhodoplanes sinuspersici]